MLSPKSPPENVRDTHRGWCNLDACVLAQRSALPRCSLSHVGALTPDFTRLGLPETKTAFPSPTPFLLLVLILAHPSLLVLFLLPSAYLLHPIPWVIPPHSHSSVLPNLFPLLQLPLQTLPSDLVPLLWLPSLPLPQTRPPSRAGFCFPSARGFSTRLASPAILLVRYLPSPSLGEICTL